MLGESSAAEEGGRPASQDQSGVEAAETPGTVVWRTYSRFLRNAWRRKVEEVQIKEIAYKQAQSQVSQLKLQIGSLKSLLKADEQVIAGSFREINNLKTLLGKVHAEYEASKKEREECRERVNSLKEELHLERSESLNCKNSLELARSEASALENALDRERGKLARLKTENRTLMEKVDKYVINLKNKADKVNRLSENVDQLEKQMSSYTQILRNSQIKTDQDQRALTEAKECVERMRRELVESGCREVRLRKALEERDSRAGEEALRSKALLKEQRLALVRLETELAMKESAATRYPLRVTLLTLLTSALHLPLCLLTLLGGAAH